MHFLFRAPSTYVCGDLHLENFGAYKGDNRLCYFDINDFDEACLAPFTIDIVRFMAGVDLAARELGFSRAQGRKFVKRFRVEYVRSIGSGKPRWIERSLAQGVFRDLLRRAMRRSRRALLNRYTKTKNGSRRLRIDGKRVLAIGALDKERLREFSNRLRVPSTDRRFFRFIDAGRRVAGNGSLGLERFVLLVRGRGSPDQNFVLDLKFAAPSAVVHWLRRSQPGWQDEAVRVTRIQRTMQAIAPALLHAVVYRGQHFILKELQPSIDRLDTAQWRKKPRRFEQAVAGMGRVAAWAHLRSCGHDGTASVEDLQAYVSGKRWARAAERLSASSADDIRHAWRTYAKDYDAGALAAT